MSQSLSDEVALRIGLASRELPDIDNRQLLEALFAIMGKPVSVRKLSRLRFNALKRQLEQQNQHSEEASLRRALAFLKGKGIHCEPPPLPVVTAYREGDLPASVRVGCSSDNGHMIDGQFATCSHFLVYQVAADEYRLIDIRIAGKGQTGIDKHSERADIVADCHVLVTLDIGGLAASKVIKAGIHPMKLEQAVPAVVFIREIQQVLRTTPPPWLAKAMGQELAATQLSQRRQQYGESTAD